MDNLAIRDTSWYAHSYILNSWKGDHTAGTRVCLRLANSQGGAHIIGKVAGRPRPKDKLARLLLHCLLKGAGKGGDRRKAVFGFLSQGTQEHCVNGRGQMWIERAGRCWLSMEVLVHELFHATYKGWT